LVLTTHDLIAGLALLLSAYLAWLRYRDTRARPDLRLDMDWIQGGGGPTTLVIVATNRGDARGGVRAVVFSPTRNLDPATGFYLMRMVERLPVMLDPGHFERLPVELYPNDDTTFTKRILQGGFSHAILVDQDQKAHPFAIPEKPPETGNRTSTYGRVAKR
jgi:hypothetical protein